MLCSSTQQMRWLKHAPVKFRQFGKLWFRSHKTHGGRCTVTSIPSSWSKNSLIIFQLGMFSAGSSAFCCFFSFHSLMHSSWSLFFILFKTNNVMNISPACVHRFAFLNICCNKWLFSLNKDFGASDGMSNNFVTICCAWIYGSSYIFSSTCQASWNSSHWFMTAFAWPFLHASFRTINFTSSDISLLLITWDVNTTSNSYHPKYVPLNAGTIFNKSSAAFRFLVSTAFPLLFASRLKDFWI